MTVQVGDYVRPIDGMDGDPDNIHALEGICFGIDRMAHPDTGEIVEAYHTAHINAGRLRWSILWSDRVGDSNPAGPADIDSLMKAAGDLLRKDGRKVPKRVWVLVAQLGPLCERMPQVDAPSIFEPLPGADMGDDAEWTRREPQPVGGARPPVTRPLAQLLEDRVAALPPSDGNEVKRQARLAGLGPLHDTPTLRDLADWTALVDRYERIAARRAQQQQEAS